jgi:nicotinate-nucleotide--dimethylbenzimidazole phosphoribosyltransferase
MPYCQHCGNKVEQLAEAAHQADAAEVEIARINAERDVAVARIQAREHRDELETAETIAETEAEAEVASAEATAEIIGEVLASEQPDAEPEPEPVIVTEPAPVEDDVAPPEVDGHHGGQPKAKSAWSFG